jgi:signal transduction histidine kinase
VLDAADIVEALEWEIEECNRYFDVEAELVCEEEEIALDRKKSLAVFRIVQESMTNSVRHGGARKIRIHLQRDEGMLILRVEDDGRGFEPGKEFSSFGLLGMRERALQCGGDFRIESSPGGGTVVYASIPLADQMS